MDEEKYWQAVVERDSGYDGQFVYGVRSTGIYCRPSCPSRRADRKQVTFYAGPEEAEAAGFRACKRCLPKEIHPQKALVEQIRAVIEAHAEEKITLEKLAEAVNVSPFHLQRVFKKVMGLSPRQYAEAYRLEQVKRGLKDGQAVTDSIYEAGYSSSSRLYEKTNEKLGMTPAVYRKGGAGMEMVYTIVKSKLGAVLIAATNKGICNISMGDDIQMLKQNLDKEYPAARIARDDEALKGWAGPVVAAIEGQKTATDLPLDIQGTVFQSRVWQALQQIPVGSTRTYSQIAEAIGQPTAARAVANACANNKLAVVIPCHRVIREDGSLGGYRWGMNRKQQLLQQEHALPAARQLTLA